MRTKFDIFVFIPRFPVATTVKQNVDIKEIEGHATQWPKEKNSQQNTT
jgi:hypothetical protein